MDGRAVLYLDVDDTLINWAGYQARPARGLREFLLWALERYEVRWLTRRCPSGKMPDRLVEELCRMADIEPELLRPIRGLDWQGCESKLNGIAWLEHLVHGRPFVWVEDDNGVGDLELGHLAEHGCGDSYHHCNVSMAPDALQRVHEALRRGGAPAAAALPPCPASGGSPPPS